MTLTAATFVPQGFTDGRHPRISPRLGRQIDILGTAASTLRTLVLTKDGADADAIGRVVAQHPRWVAMERAPSLLELRLPIEELADVTSRDDLFTWIEAGDRLAGPNVTEPSAMVSVRLSLFDARTAKDLISGLGGSLAGQGQGGLYLAALPARHLGALVRSDAVETIEVTDPGL